MAERQVLKQLFINDKNVVANYESFSYNRGGGETNVEAMGAGGGEVEVVTGQNIATQLGMVTGELPNTQASKDIISEMTGQGNTIQLVFEDDIVTFDDMWFTTEPDIPAGSDTNISFECKGGKAY